MLGDVPALPYLIDWFRLHRAVLSNSRLADLGPEQLLVSGYVEETRQTLRALQQSHSPQV